MFVERTIPGAPNFDQLVGQKLLFDGFFHRIAETRFTDLHDRR
jgi:hypothetical protein